MSSEKNYIGSGKTTLHNGVKVTIRMDEAMQHIYTTDKGRFLTFMVSPKKEADQYGKTHSAFVMPREERAPDTNVANEPQGLPEGTTVEVDGKKLRKISKQQAAIIRRKKEQAQA